MTEVRRDRASASARAAHVIARGIGVLGMGFVLLACQCVAPLVYVAIWLVRRRTPGDGRVELAPAKLALTAARSEASPDPAPPPSAPRRRCGRSMNAGRPIGCEPGDQSARSCLG
jgi:hypothetical protein